MPQVQEVTKSRKDLLIRCYRMALTLVEVRHVLHRIPGLIRLSQKKELVRHRKTVIETIALPYTMTRALGEVRPVGQQCGRVAAAHGN